MRTSCLQILRLGTPRQACRHSRAATAAITSPASGSAHDQPRVAFSISPTSRTPDKYVHNSVWVPSATTRTGILIHVYAQVLELSGVRPDAHLSRAIMMALNSINRLASTVLASVVR